MTRTARKARGFTLIELVIVIAVIAILAALLVPTILGQAERARASRAKQDVTNIAKAAARIRVDTQSTTAGCYTNIGNYDDASAPSDCGTGLPDCKAATTQPGALCWGGPYMSAAPDKDPWGNAYTASYNSTDGRVTVTSGGSAAAGDDLTSVQ